MTDALVAYRPGAMTTPARLSEGAEETARKALAPGTLALYRAIGAQARPMVAGAGVGTG